MWHAIRLCSFSIFMKGGYKMNTWRCYDYLSWIVHTIMSQECWTRFLWAHCVDMSKGYACALKWIHYDAVGWQHTAHTQVNAVHDWVEPNQIVQTMISSNPVHQSNPQSSPVIRYDLYMSCCLSLAIHLCNLGEMFDCNQVMSPSNQQHTAGSSLQCTHIISQLWQSWRLKFYFHLFSIQSFISLSSCFQALGTCM